VKVTGYDRDGELWILHLRNDSQSALTALTLSLGWGVSVYPDFTNNPVPPRGTFDFHAPVGAPPFDPNAPAKNHSDPQEITIMAAAFEDQTSEGDFGEVQGILYRRKGFALGLERINALLADALSGKTDILTTRNLINDLPEELTPKAGFNMGVKMAKTMTLNVLDPIADWHREGGQGTRRVTLLGPTEFTSPREALGDLLQRNQIALQLRQKGGKIK
jgi:hypothetical protein